MDLHSALSGTLGDEAFEVPLGEHLRLERPLFNQGVPTKYALHHGNQLSFYVEDPEGRLIEIHGLINVRFPPPLADPIVLDLPEEELLREVERVARQFGLPTSSTSRCASWQQGWGRGPHADVCRACGLCVVGCPEKKKGRRCRFCLHNPIPSAKQGRPKSGEASRVRTIY